MGSVIRYGTALMRFGLLFTFCVFHLEDKLILVHLLLAPRYIRYIPRETACPQANDVILETVTRIHPNSQGTFVPQVE